MSLLVATFLCATGVTTILAVTSGADLFAVGAPQPTTPTIAGETLCAKLINLIPNAPPAMAQNQQKRYQACLDAYNTRLTPHPVSARQQTFEAPHTLNAPTLYIPRTPAGAGAIVDKSGWPLGPLYVIENSWVFEAQGKRYEVFAGARREEGPPQPTDSMQGFISVWVWDMASGNLLNEGSYLELPVKKGPLKIVSGQGQQLVLQTDDGTKFYFDLPKRSFIAALDTPTPVIPPTQAAYP
ncbi:MAG: hypothetical protein M1482_03690 [Chloroflexi bacterium]|nr:hypothetical protein [Chloroflexota bacterium]